MGTFADSLRQCKTAIETRREVIPATCARGTWRAYVQVREGMFQLASESLASLAREVRRCVECNSITMGKKRRCW